MSVFGDGSNFDFDKVTNGPGNVCAPLLIPYPSSRSKVADSNGSGWDYTLNWTPIANLKGYYDTDPGNNIITGLAVYYQTTSSATPPSNALSGWTLASGGTPNYTGYVNWGASGSDPGTISVYVPNTPDGQYTYVAFALLFDGAAPGDAIRMTQFLGLAAAGPTASPLFANVTADPTTVAWTSGDESRVASYQAYMSLTQNGTYRAIGQPVAALGSGHSYTVNYRVVAPTYYVKIKASKTDGTFVWSSAVKVTRLAPAPKPLPGKAGLRK
jgi:hypothetical protein